MTKHIKFAGRFIAVSVRLLITWVQLRKWMSGYLLVVGSMGAVLFEQLSPDTFRWIIPPLICGAVFLYQFRKDFRWGLAIARANEKDKDKSLTAILIAALAVLPMQPAQAKEDFQPAAGPTLAAGIGLGVLVGTAYIAIRVVRVCAKRKKQMTNLYPERADMFLAAADADKYAGLCVYEDDSYCEFEAASDSAQNGFVISGIVDLDMNWKPFVTVSSVTHVREAGLVSFDRFNSDLNQWGVSWNGVGGDMQYAKNSQTADGDDMPFAFLTGVCGVSIYPDRHQYHVVVETAKTTSLGTQWELLVHTFIPAGVPFNIIDTPPGDQTFYRMRIVQ